MADQNQMNYLTTSQLPKPEYADWIMEQVTLLALAVGDKTTPEGLRLYAQDLSDIAPEILDLGFRKIRREWKFSKLPSIGAIREACGHKHDGRPGPEEAWARMPKGEMMEAETVVWCEEERQAYGACRGLLESDPIAARMCFLERYKAELEESRLRNITPKWTVSCGHDVTDRISKIAQAVSEKKLTVKVAENWIPLERTEEFNRMLPAHSGNKVLPGETVKLTGFYGLLQKMRIEGTLPKDIEIRKTAPYTRMTDEQWKARKQFVKDQAKVYFAELKKKHDTQINADQEKHEANSQAQEKA